MRLAPVMFEPWAEVLLDAVRVSPGDRVLDVASGTGVVARAAASRAGPEGSVVGVDVSEPMLSLAAAGPLPEDSAPIEYLEARADQLPFPDRSFDVVLCQQGLQFFAERLDAAREMHRVVRPGGVVGASVWAAGYRLEPFDDYGEALAATGVEPPFPRAFENSAFAMSDGACRELFEDAGFPTVEVSVVEQTVAFREPGPRPTGSSGPRSDRSSRRCRALRARRSGRIFCDGSVRNRSESRFAERPPPSWFAPPRAREFGPPRKLHAGRGVARGHRHPLACLPCARS